MQRRLAHMAVCVVGLVACGFDSGGVGGPVDGGLGDESGMPDSSETTSAQPAETGADTQGSADQGNENATSSGVDPSTSSSGELPDPCATAKCDPDASCSPDPSGEVGVCDCNAGFVGNGVVCDLMPMMPMLRAEAECGTKALGYCTTGGGDAQVQLVGEPGAAYLVTLHVRGVVEEKSYDGGAPVGQWHPDGEPGDFDLWNEVTLSISAPAQIIRLNSGSSGNASCLLVDMTHDVAILAGATLGLSFDAIDGSQVANDDDLVVPGIPPAPNPFDGQFLQIDATMIVPG